MKSCSLARVARIPNCIFAFDAQDCGRWLSPIRNGGAWPRGSGRNFSEALCHWGELSRKLREIATADFSLSVTFRIQSLVDAKRNVLSTRQGAGLDTFFITTPVSGQADMFAFFLYFGALSGANCTIVKKIPAAVRYTDAALGYVGIDARYCDRSQVNTVRLVRLAGRLELWLNGELTVTVTGQVGDLSVLPNALPLVSWFDGGIEEIALACGEQERFLYRRSALDWVEQVGLIAPDNAVRRNGCYEVEDAALAWAIRIPCLIAPAAILAFDRKGQRLAPTFADGVISFGTATTVGSVLGFNRVLSSAEIAAIARCACRSGQSADV